jgi:type I site-specific restriction endonuclease
MDLSEKETREKIIDPWLREGAGWREEYLKREVNSVKSDFKIKKYEIKKGEIEKRNYNLDINNPTKPEAEKELSKEEIIQKIEANIKRTSEILKEIKEVW